MGNYISCTLSAPLGNRKNSRPAKVIFPDGEIRNLQQPTKAAELMLETPNFFLVNSKSLHIGRRFSALSADEDLEFSDVYVMFPMKRVHSMVTAADVGMLFLAANSAAKRAPTAAIGNVRVLPDCGEAVRERQENEEAVPKLNLEEVHEEFSTPEFKVPSCLDRAKSRRGSTNLMVKWEIFSGILGNNASQNPDFYNWNRVKIRYCDGASFAGDSTYLNGKSLLYFRGARIWKAVINDLLPKGLANAEKALLSGCSAGGLASFLHCDNFTQHLPKTATVKCLSDAGFFMDGRDINSNYPMRSFYSKLVSLQGVEKNLDKNCTCSLADPKQCIFPQYLLPFIKTPFFILNAAYDVYQFHHTLVPPSADTGGHWVRCKSNPAACNANQTNFLQEYRDDMIAALAPFEKSTTGGLFINSCFAHCQSESQDTWFAPDSPTINDQSIAKTVGDWFFERKAAKEIDCPYPCDKTCHNLLPETTD